MKKILWSISFLFVLIIEMFPQDFVVSPDKVNVIYYGIRNPLKAIVENNDCSSVQIFTNNGKTGGNECDLYIIPDEPGSADITVKLIMETDTVAVGTTHFKIEYVPDPVAKVGGREGGLIEKSILLGQFGIVAELIDFEFDVKFKIESYSVVILNDKNIIYEKDFDGNIFSAELKAAIKDTWPKYVIRFDKLKAVGEDRTTRTLKPASFIIK